MHVAAKLTAQKIEVDLQDGSSKTVTGSYSLIPGLDDAEYTITSDGLFGIDHLAKR
jgi:hypothetical protein